MKIKKIFSLLFVIGVIAIIGIKNVSAAGWSTYLNLPYGEIYGGSSRRYDSGKHHAWFSVDGFNRQNGTVRTSGTTYMALSLHSMNGIELSYEGRTFTYATCLDVNMGTQAAGWKYYYFYSSIYNEATDTYTDYDGLKANQVYLYPYPTS